MAEYIRFEIYIPVSYKIEEQDTNTGMKRQVTHAFDQETIRQFIAATQQKFRGITQANPVGPSPFKGWWRENQDSPIEVDRLTYCIGLARIDQEEEAIDHFTYWKQKFEQNLSQKVILVTYYTLHVIGDFF
jgi:hypothetical protein